MWRPHFYVSIKRAEPASFEVIVNHDNITDITTYLRAHAIELGERILSTFPPLQNTTDPVAPRIATMLRKALPAQASGDYRDSEVFA